MELENRFRELSKLAGDTDLLAWLECYTEGLRELLFSPRYRFDSAVHIPAKPGVYVIWRGSKVIYVGSTSNMKRRLLNNHLRGKVGNSRLRRALSWELGIANFGSKEKLDQEEEERITKHLVAHCEFQYFVIENRRRRKMLEHYAIALLDPKLVSPIVKAT
ncbi:MAG: GIY-YIG nuclease family protein [Thermoproteales archaeon]|nr:GIY-YIG nuclease family protein [Thermoproteales archaeon]